MAYRKRKFYKRRPFRRSTKRIGRKFKSYVKRTISRTLEKKSYSFTMNQSPFSTMSGTAEYLFCNPSQSTTSTGRIGRKIKITKIRFSGCVIAGGQSNLGTDDKYNVVRLCLATWKKGITLTPFATNSIGIGTPLDRDTYQLLGKVYYDKTLIMNTAGRDSTGYLPTIRKWSMKKKFKNLVINYADETATYWDKQLFFSVATDSGLAPSPGFIAGTMRVWWEDA